MAENVSNTKDIRQFLDKDSLQMVWNKIMSTIDAELKKVSDASKLIETTYTELVDLKNKSILLPGVKYKITDYVTTTSQENTQSEEHKFNIIVEAVSINELSEDASACLVSGDTYFANSNITSWKLKYCLDNDTNRFAWADEEKGKGVIYKMIDEHNNEAPYDFKNIKFKHPANDIFCYTFTCYDTDTSASSKICDATVHTSSLRCYNNIIKPYYISTASITNKRIQKLNHIICGYAPDEWINIASQMKTLFSVNSNIFDYNCYNITLGYGNCNNYFSENCHDIIISTNKNDIESNQVSQRFVKNMYFGIGCHDLILYKNVTTALTNQLQNFKINNGVNKVTIELEGDIVTNRKFITEIGYNSNNEIIQYISGGSESLNGVKYSINNNNIDFTSSNVSVSGTNLILDGNNVSVSGDTLIIK